MHKSIILEFCILIFQHPQNMSKDNKKLQIVKPGWNIYLQFLFNYSYLCLSMEQNQIKKG